MTAITRVGWNILSEWWCVPIDATPDQVINAVLEHTSAPTSNREHIKDRFYGGFKCEVTGNRHICFNTGQYTYLGENSALEKSDREESWIKLIEGSKENGPFIGGGPFVEDAPKEEVKNHELE